MREQREELGSWEDVVQNYSAPKVVNTLHPTELYPYISASL